MIKAWERIRGSALIWPTKRKNQLHNTYRGSPVFSQVSERRRANIDLSSLPISLKFRSTKYTFPHHCSLATQTKEKQFPAVAPNLLLFTWTVLLWLQKCLEMAHLPLSFLSEMDKISRRKECFSLPELFKMAIILQPIHSPK